MLNFAAIGLAAASTIVAAFGMILLKKSSGTEFKKLLFDFRFFLGGLFFVLGVGFMVLALKLEALSVVFPVTSLTYVWVILLSSKFLNEKINRWKVATIALIVIGMVLAVI